MTLGDAVLYALVGLGFMASVLALDYLFKAAARGGVFGKIAPKGARDMGAAALELQSILEPSKKHQLEVQRADESKEKHEEPGAGRGVS